MEAWLLVSLLLYGIGVATNYFMALEMVISDRLLLSTYFSLKRKGIPEAEDLFLLCNDEISEEEHLDERELSSENPWLDTASAVVVALLWPITDAWIILSMVFDRKSS